MRIGVLGALPQEVASIVAMLDQPDRLRAGGREFVRARLGPAEIVVAHSRIGKVAAAAATVELVARFGVDQVVFLGVAGSLRDDLASGDIVVADRLVQHDLDASPLFPAMEIPLLGRAFLETDPDLARRLEHAARAFLDEDRPARTRVGASGPQRVVRGDVATGDQFISDAAARALVQRRVPSALCVEMEGAAAAQVCREYDVPLGVARVISDQADDHAPHAFAGSLERFAGECAAGIMLRYLHTA